MNSESDRLREAWRTNDRREGDPAACPDESRIWQAVTGALEVRQRHEVIAHTACCPACAAAWRAARELTPSESVPRARLAGNARPWLALAAACVLVSVSVALYLTRSGAIPDSASLRSATPGALASLLPDHVRLPREQFVLRWTAGPAGTFYTVEVGSESLRSVARGVALAQPEFQVPAAALGEIPSGTTLVWRVEAQLPTGERVASVANFAVVE